jgi:hypothetical protein
MSAVFTLDDDQRRRALESKTLLERRLGRPIATPILPIARFYLAEDYHQKYSLRNSPLIREFEAIYPDPAAFTRSTAAARVNGYLAGDGSPDQLKSEIDRLGLSAEGRRLLLRSAGGD